MAFFSVYLYSTFKQQNPKSVNHKALLWLVGIYILDGMNKHSGYKQHYIYIQGGGGFVGLQPPQNIWSSLTEERFSDMAVIAIHYQERLPVEDILKAFIQQHPRRIFLKSVLED